MKKITFEELIDLENGGKFYVYHRRKHEFKGYKKVGTHDIHSLGTISVIGANEDDFNKATVFKSNCEFYTGYSSKKVGDILIKGLLEEIESVKETYLECNQN